MGAQRLREILRKNAKESKHNWKVVDCRRTKVDTKKRFRDLEKSEITKK